MGGKAALRSVAAVAGRERLAVARPAPRGSLALCSRAGLRGGGNGIRRSAARLRALSRRESDVARVDLSSGWWSNAGTADSRAAADDAGMASTAWRSAHRRCVRPDDVRHDGHGDRPALGRVHRRCRCRAADDLSLALRAWQLRHRGAQRPSLPGDRSRAGGCEAPQRRHRRSGQDHSLVSGFYSWRTALWRRAHSRADPGRGGQWHSGLDPVEPG